MPSMRGLCWVPVPRLFGGGSWGSWGSGDYIGVILEGWKIKWNLLWGLGFEDFRRFLFEELLEFFARLKGGVQWEFPKIGDPILDPRIL